MNESERVRCRRAEALWQEAEQHLRAFEQLPHGDWTPALRERGIAPASARRVIQLRKQYPQIAQIERFGSVSAALTDKKSKKTEGDSPNKTHSVTAYLVSADDLWDWERGEVSTLARRLLDENELEEFTDNVTGELRFLADSFESGDLLSASLYMMRRLACHVNIGPLQEDAAAISETKRRLSVFSESVGQLIDRSTQD